MVLSYIKLNLQINSMQSCSDLSLKMKSLLSVGAFLALCVGIQARELTEPSENVIQTGNSTRDGKFFSLFSIVRFSNDACVGNNNYNGTCLTAAECSSQGGTAAGSCAQSFGVCCTFLITKCGSTTNRNCTYWQSTSSSSYTNSGQCLLTVQKCSSNICQLRLDFIAFTLAQPDPQDQRCVLDLFTVTGASNPVPTICGDNTGQHIYLDMTPNTNSWTLGFVTTGTNFTRNWNVKISQIPCNYNYAAPSNCLQYYTETSGTIKSFNYATTAVSSTTAGRQLSNQDYTICIRMAQGFCGVCYSTCTDTANTNSKAFTISRDATAATPVGTLVDASCVNDWLQIPCASNAMNSPTQSGSVTPTSCTTRICGTVFSSYSSPTLTAPVPVYSYSKPFELRFYADTTEVSSTTAEKANLGFCLNYVQQPCTSSG